MLLSQFRIKPKASYQFATPRARRVASKRTWHYRTGPFVLVLVLVIVIVIDLSVPAVIVFDL